MTINDALKTIDDVIKEKKEEISQLSHINREGLGNSFKEELKDSLQSSMGQLQKNFEDGKEVAIAAYKMFDEELRKNPWKALSVVALGAYFLGAHLKSKTKELT